MGTIAKSRLQGSDLIVQQHFLWVQLRCDGEPIHGLLQRFLQRKILSKVGTCMFEFEHTGYHKGCSTLFVGQGNEEDLEIAASSSI